MRAVKADLIMSYLIQTAVRIMDRTPERYRRATHGINLLHADGREQALEYLLQQAKQVDDIEVRQIIHKITQIIRTIPIDSGVIQQKHSTHPTGGWHDADNEEVRGHKSY